MHRGSAIVGKMNTFESTAPPISTAEATQKLKEILNLGQCQSAGIISSEKPTNFMNGNCEPNSVSKVYSDGTRMLDSITKASTIKQNITLQGNNDFCSFDIYGQNVTITTSAPNQVSGNSKVRIKNIVDYGWESKYYYGQLVAVHMSGTYIAYGGIIARDNFSGIIRVVNRTTGDRTLIKGMTGYVKDLAFAHIANEVLLAVIDEVGNLFVYNIKERDGKVAWDLALHIAQSENTKPSDFHRVIWCQYIPDEGIEDDEGNSVEDAAKLLVVTHDNRAEMINMDIIVKNYGEGPLMSRELVKGYQIISDHLQPIVDAAFSPDGAALATASLDGEVKFFQVYMHHSDTMPPSRCLHQWKPHDGKPLSCIFFLDNHKNHNPEAQFWKFAITGADNNQEIKIWCCESWNCLQSINFVIPPGETLQPCMKAGLDLSAAYLILSDISRKVLYVLMLYQDPDTKVANISSISEFPLSFPMLSYAITDASRKKYKQSVDAEHIEEFNAENNELSEEDVQDDMKFVEGVVVRLFFIQPKSLQECRIAFQPRSSAPFPACSVSSLSQDSMTTGFRDRLSDMSFDASMGNEVDLMGPEDTSLTRTALSQPAASPGQILLTPDAFASPNHMGPNPMLTPTSAFPNSTPTSVPLPPVTPSEEIVLAMTPGQEKSLSAKSDIIEHEHRQSGRSSGSSPSLEVQQILAPRKASLTEADDKGRDIDSRNSNIDNSMIFSAPLPPPVSVGSDSMRHSEVLASLPMPVPAASIASKEYDPTIWPLAPNLNNEMKVISNDPAKGRDDMQSFSTNGSGDSILKISPFPVIYNSKIETVENKLDEAVKGIVANQRTITQSIQALKIEMQEMREESKKQPGFTSIAQNMGQLFEKLEAVVTSLMERKFLQMKQADNNHLEKLLLKLEEKESLRHERMTSLLLQTINNIMTNGLDTIVKTEVRNVFPQALDGIFESLKQQFRMEISQKFSDEMLKETMGKLLSKLKNKQVIETIGGQTASALQVHIQSSYEETFQATVIPAFEKASQNVFHQLNETFQKGTKEYSHLLETYLEQKRSQSDQTKDEFVSKLQNFMTVFQASTDQTLTTLSTKLQKDLETQLSCNLAIMQDVLTKRIQRSVKDEIKNAMKEQQNVIGDSVMHAIRSGAVTPIPAPDPQMLQARIAQSIRQGQLNSAFQQALSASDLSLVTFVCESIPPATVFSKTPCILDQSVLLSLIQQLSADLTTQTELKLKYLQEAILSLDRNNPKEHVELAIGLMQQKLQQLTKTNTNTDYARMMKMLLMTSQSLLIN